MPLKKPGYNYPPVIVQEQLEGIYFNFQSKLGQGCVHTLDLKDYGHSQMSFLISCHALSPTNLNCSFRQQHLASKLQSWATCALHQLSRYLWKPSIYWTYLINCVYPAPLYSQAIGILRTYFYHHFLAVSNSPISDYLLVQNLQEKQH